jgi:hypothetical protein
MPTALAFLTRHAAFCLLTPTLERPLPRSCSTVGGRRHVTRAWQCCARMACNVDPERFQPTQPTQLHAQPGERGLRVAILPPPAAQRAGLTRVAPGRDGVASPSGGACGEGEEEG